MDKLPSAQELLVEAPLYHSCPVSYYELHRSGLKWFSGSVNAYCVDCRQSSIFQGDNGPALPTFTERPGGSTRQPARPAEGVFLVKVVCSRDRDHVMRVMFHYGQERLTKVGQYPSLADMLLPQLDPYRSVLTNDSRKELGTAIGLHAHGVGIGAFVYLRRTFETLVEEAHQEVTADPEWDDGAYERSRMDERIQMLRAHLPEILVENASIYGILSKGIHELSDTECNGHFDTVRRGIELILDERLETLRRQRKRKALTHEVGRAKGKLKGQRRKSGRDEGKDG